MLLLGLSEDEVGQDEGRHHCEEGLPDSPQSVGQSFKIEFDGMILVEKNKHYLVKKRRRKLSAPEERCGTWWFP